MRDLLLPRTDTAVLVQLVVLGVTWLVAAVALRRQREWLSVVTGVALLILGWFALRAVH